MAANRRGKHARGRSPSLSLTSSSEGEAEPPAHVPAGHDVVERVLAFDPNDNTYLVRWRGFPATQRTWEPSANLSRGGTGAAVERFRRRDIANVGWVFASEGAKRRFHKKHTLIDMGDLPVPIPDPNHNAELHAVSQAQRASYVRWLKERIGQCEWVAGCTHRVSQADGDRGWPLACFDFHHVRADTKVNSVSKMPVNTFPAESIWAEAAKCILLCKMHHAIIEHVTHGGEQGFSPECTARGAGCEFRGHSLYEYVHPDARRHAQQEKGSTWTTQELLAERGRPWRPQDEPAPRQPGRKRRGASGAAVL